MATIRNDLSLDWRIDNEPAGYLAGVPFAGGDSPYNPRVLSSRRRWSEYFAVETTPIDSQDSTYGGNTNSPISGNSYGAQPVHYFFLGDHHFRIWCVPPKLIVTNPIIGFPYEFHIWNTYLVSNSLTTVGGTGQTGLTLNFTPPVAYDRIEYKLATVTIGATAPIEIDADYDFTFSTGAGFFEFVASLARFIDVAPEPPVQETWEFLTDLIKLYDGSEQRIALRENPRMTQRFSLLLEGDTDRRNEYTQWYKSLPASVVIPYAAYSAPVVADAVQGATKLYFDPARTDMRDGDFLIVLDPATDEGEIAIISTVDADGATLTAGIGSAVRAGAYVCAGLRSRLANPSGLGMMAITGSMQVNSSALDPRNPLSRPGSTATIQTFDGYNVLHIRPLAEKSVEDIFDAGYEVIDNKTGSVRVDTAWPHPQVSGKRQYLIQRWFNPEEMDYWRDFMDAAKGQQNPFLLPSFREDLVKAAEPGDGSATLDIITADYENQYFPYETYKRIQIETSGAGILWRLVNDVVNNEDGTWTLALDTVIPAGYGSIEKISFLNLVRLGSDKVELTHDHQISYIEFLVRAIDE